MSVFSTFSGVVLLPDPAEHPAASIMIAVAVATPTFRSLIVSPAEFAWSHICSGKRWQTPQTPMAAACIVIQHNARRCLAHAERDDSPLDVSLLSLGDNHHCYQIVIVGAWLGQLVTPCRYR
jgi:hypothetical protein